MEVLLRFCASIYVYSIVFYCSFHSTIWLYILAHDNLCFQSKIVTSPLRGPSSSAMHTLNEWEMTHLKPSTLILPPLSWTQIGPATTVGLHDVDAFIKQSMLALNFYSVYQLAIIDYCIAAGSFWSIVWLSTEGKVNLNWPSASIGNCPTILMLISASLPDGRFPMQT